MKTVKSGRCRMLVALSTIAIIASTAACGGTGTAPADTANAHPAATGELPDGFASGMRFTYLSAPLGDPNYGSVACGAQIEAKRLGATVDHQESQEFTASSQIPVLNAAAAAQPNGLLVTPTDPVGLMAPLRSIVRSGVPVLTVINQLKDASGVNAEVAVDNAGAGRAAAEFLAQQAGGKPVTLASLGFTAGGSLASDDELRGFADELTTYPNVTYLGPQYVGSDAGSSTQAMNALLARQPDLFGVFTAFGASAQGVLASVRQRQTTVEIVSGYAAATDEVVTALRNGQVAAIVDFPFRQAGITAMDEIARVAKGQSVTRTTSFPSVLYNRASFDDPAQAANLGTTRCPA